MSSQHSEHFPLSLQDSFPISPWTSKTPKMAQPDLDYIAPEIQLETGKGNTYLCDMFSLGMVICAIYNQGHSLIQANHSTAAYAKRVESVSERRVVTGSFGNPPRTHHTGT